MKKLIILFVLLICFAPKPSYSGSAIGGALKGEKGEKGDTGNIPLSIYTLADDQATGANVTPVTLSGLVFTYSANSTYLITIYGLVSSAAATTGCGFQFDTSTTFTRIALSFYHQLANTGTLTGGHSVADAASVGVSSGVPVLNVTYPIFATGILVTDANTGTAQLQYRSETTAVTTCKAGTKLVVQKIE